MLRSCVEMRLQRGPGECLGPVAARAHELYHKSAVFAGIPSSNKEFPIFDLRFFD